MKKKSVLVTLQMAYLESSLNKEKNDQDICMYCWKSNCGCSSGGSVKNDVFINNTYASEFAV
ncbi:hypothetical protein [Metabacillus arenae]|uniref:Bacteriocin n=1 Tax=Metabacillus arenae TaxID=2771434 RepID=A0A926NJ97_9BACI|nr:hypothetical protein [Metabacillus arenae]MBD1379137.1 hypothetical protein [Metabacillus arenae]